MKILICLSILAISSSYATYVTYPYVYRTQLLQNNFYPTGFGFSSLGAPALTVVKPYYPGFYDYRFGLSPSLYQPGLYPGAGVYATAPTIIHLIPAEPDSDKKKKKPKKGKPKEENDDETTTMSSEDSKREEVEKAEAKDEEKNDSIEVETV